MLNKPWFSKLALGLCAPMLLCVPPAAAVIHVRDVVWTRPGEILPYPEVSRVQVTFRADLTERDRDQGVEFSIDVPGATPHLLVFRGSIEHAAQLSAATFDVQFGLTCSNAGRRVHATNASCWIRYVVPGVGEVSRLYTDVRTNSYDVSGTFGLAVIDHNQTPGPNPLLGNSLACWFENKSIGVYFDPAGAICHGTIRPGTPGTVYVLAKLNGDSNGIAGAEFRFSGVPDSWRVFPVPNPTMLAIGDPFGDGVSAGFPCQQSGDVVLLYTVLVLASEEVPNVRFTIEERIPPLTRSCPLVNLCDAPVYTSRCVTGGQCLINTTNPRDCNGRIVAIEPRSWSAMKSMYRN